MAPLSERETHTGEGWNTFTPGRLISYTPPLSAETTKVRRRADQRRELMNVACDLLSPGLKVVAYRSGRLDVN